MGKISIQSTNPIDAEQLNRLKKALGGGPVLITTHDNPDPDALAAGKAIYHLVHAVWGLPAQLFYNGLVGRAENREMLRVLTPEWGEPKRKLDLRQFSAVVFVDCQPGSRDTLIDSDPLPVVVIDHHFPILEKTRQAVYMDVRPDIGSTSTIAYQYLHAAQAEIDPVLATALFYGLRADTNGLSRGASLEDGIACVKLMEKLDKKLLLQVETAGLTQEYFQAFYKGMQNTRVYGKCIVANLGSLHRPDLPAEFADLLFRYEKTHAALCSGVYEQEIHFSIRTDLANQGAGLLVQDVVFAPGKAGGHGIMAAGQIPLNGVDPEPLIANLERRFLNSLNEKAAAKPLLP